MKKLIKIITLLLVCATFALGQLSVGVAQTDLTGGRIDISFSQADANSFVFYSNNENIGMEIREDKLFAPALSITKAVYTKDRYNDFSASVDITAVIKLGRIDSGIIFASNNFSAVPEEFDKFTGWCINVERDLGSDSCVVKLHRFEQRWVGDLCVSERIRLPKDNARLSVTVKKGIATAYLNGVAVLSYSVGWTDGSVGLRNYFAPIIFDNFSITASHIPLDKAPLEKRVAEVEKLQRSAWTEESVKRVENALENAKTALNGNSQSVIDCAFEELNKAVEKIVTVWNEQRIANLFENANTLLENRDLYIANTVASVEFLIEKCECAIEQNNGEEIAYWCEKLSRRLQLAVKYGEVGV